MMAFGDENRSKVPFFVISLQEYIPSTQLITTDVNLHHLAEVIFARFFHYKITSRPPPFHVFLFARKLLCAAHVRSGSYAPPAWGQIIYIKYLGYLPRRCLISLLTYFFSHLFILPVTFAYFCIFKNCIYLFSCRDITVMASACI